MNLSRSSIAMAKKDKRNEKQEQVFLVMVFVVPVLMIYFG